MSKYAVRRVFTGGISAYHGESVAAVPKMPEPCHGDCAHCAQVGIGRNTRRLSSGRSIETGLPSDETD